MRGLLADILVTLFIGVAAAFAVALLLVAAPMAGVGWLLGRP